MDEVEFACDRHFFVALFFGTYDRMVRNRDFLYTDSFFVCIDWKNRKRFEKKNAKGIGENDRKVRRIKESNMRGEEQ